MDTANASTDTSVKSATTIQTVSQNIFLKQRGLSSCRFNDVIVLEIEVGIYSIYIGIYFVLNCSNYLLGLGLLYFKH